MSDIEKCAKCGKKYQVIELGGQMPGSKESEDISCPYCNFTFQRRSNGTFRTNPLSEEQQ